MTHSSYFAIDATCWQAIMMLEMIKYQQKQIPECLVLVQWESKQNPLISLQYFLLEVECALRIYEVKHKQIIWHHVTPHCAVLHAILYYYHKRVWQHRTCLMFENILRQKGTEVWYAFITYKTKHEVQQMPLIHEGHSYTLLNEIKLPISNMMQCTTLQWYTFWAHVYLNKDCQWVSSISLSVLNFCLRWDDSDDECPDQTIS